MYVCMCINEELNQSINQSIKKKKKKKKKKRKMDGAPLAAPGSSYQLDCGDTVTIRHGTTDDAPIIAQYNIQMAKETENVNLDPDVILAGVKAVVGVEQGKGGVSKGRYFVVELGGRVCGQLMITYEWSDWRNAQIWWIQSVYVVEEDRKKGIYTALYSHVKEEAMKEGVCGLRLYADADNVPAQNTYRKLGMSSHYLVFEDMWRE